MPLLGAKLLQVPSLVVRDRHFQGKVQILVGNITLSLTFCYMLYIGYPKGAVLQITACTDRSSSD